MLKKLLNLINFYKAQAKGILTLTSLAFAALLLNLAFPLIFNNSNEFDNGQFKALKEAAIKFNHSLEERSTNIDTKVTLHKVIQNTTEANNSNHGSYKKDYYNNKSSRQALKKDSPKKIKPLIGINSATPKDLEAIPYIGPVFSKRIIKYRDMIGGFYSKTQFKEIYNLTPEALGNLSKYTQIDTMSIRRININIPNNKQIWSIPYLDYSQKKILFYYIKDKGTISTLGQLYDIHGIDKKLIDKITPYITLK